MHRALGVRGPPLAIMQADRIAFASAEFADLTCYTQAELTGPEFRLSYLFPPHETPSLAGVAVGETESRRATLAPLRGSPVACDLLLLGLAPEPTTATLLLVDPGPGGGRPVVPRDAPNMTRAMAHALRTAIEEELIRFDALQARLEKIEVAPGGGVAEHAGGLALAHEDIAQIGQARGRLDARLARIAPPVSREPELVSVASRASRMRALLARLQQVFTAREPDLV